MEPYDYKGSKKDKQVFDKSLCPIAKVILPNNEITLKTGRAASSKRFLGSEVITWSVSNDTTLSNFCKDSTIDFDFKLKLNSSSTIIVW